MDVSLWTLHQCGRHCDLSDALISAGVPHTADEIKHQSGGLIDSQAVDGSVFSSSVKKQEKKQPLRPNQTGGILGKRETVTRIFCCWPHLTQKADCSLYLSHPVGTIEPAFLFILDSVFC